MLPEAVKRAVVRHEDYSLAVGARKATANVAANAVISAAPATLLITIMRYNGIDWWPESADPAATATIMTMLTGIPRWFGDWFAWNIVQPRYEAQQAANGPQGE